MPTRHFTRAEILDVRARASAGETAPTIQRLYPEVGLETLRRIIRRETYRDVGVGPTERASVRAHLADGEALSPPASELERLEREALESAKRFTEGLPGLQAPNEATDVDPLQEFLGIRREGKTEGA